jgi:hypothetical protein
MIEPRLSPYHQARQQLGGHDAALEYLHSGRQPLIEAPRRVKPAPKRQPKGGRK